MRLVCDTTVDTGWFNIPGGYPLDFIEEYTTLRGQMTQLLNAGSSSRHSYAKERLMPAIRAAFPGDAPERSSSMNLSLIGCWSTSLRSHGPYYRAIL